MSGKEMLRFGIAFLGIIAVGCAPWDVATSLPDGQEIVQGLLRIHGDFALASEHRLLVELCERKSDIEETLRIELNSEPIDVYLFSEGKRFKRFTKQVTPRMADRRALFIEDDVGLKVVAHWNATVGEDLRHELTHAYLHSSIHWMPLWMDEGLAEYFERPRGQENSHPVHIAELASEFRAGRWHPDLRRLETCEDPATFSQLDYAEAWLWVHYFLNGPATTKDNFLDYLQVLKTKGSRRDKLSVRLEAIAEQIDLEILEHLKTLATSEAQSSDKGSMSIR